MSWDDFKDLEGNDHGLFDDVAYLAILRKA
jgi:hypothetical protein